MKKNKSFDCVEMKNRIQEELWKEYESRKADFASYADFINVTAEETKEIKEFRKNLSISGKSVYRVGRQT
ncbi:hypothetical protein JW926_05140 [Candidatus Sumerlaeota bacterium]|nr:hypothetical protein [Candidatus Sumerlaeota bacterium]